MGQATIPATDSPEDYAAAEKVQKSVEFGNHFNNAWWFEPACLGHYPETGLKTYAEHMPDFPDSDFDIIKQVPGKLRDFAADTHIFSSAI